APTIGRGRPDDGAAGGLQLHGLAGQAALAAVQGLIAVDVVEERAADSAGVIVVGQRDVVGVEVVVVRVGADRRGGHDAVAHVPFIEEIVDSGDEDGLGGVPVGGREGQAGDRGDALVGIAGGNTDDDVGGRLLVEHDVKGGGQAGLGGGQAGGRIDRDTG